MLEMEISGGFALRFQTPFSQCVIPDAVIQIVPDALHHCGLPGNRPDEMEGL